MKRVLLLTLEYPPDHGGIATYLFSIHHNLPDCFVMQSSLWKWWPRWLPTLWQTAERLRKEGSELIAVSHVLPMGYVALFFYFIRRVPYVVFVHGLDILRAEKTPWKRWWLGRILRSAKQVVANSEFTRALAERAGAPTGRLMVFLPCLPALPPPRESRVQDAEIILLSVGRLVRRKNHTLVLQTLPKLTREFPKLKYVILGRGPLRGELEARAHELSVEDQVLFVPNATDEAREEWYRRADIFVLPTISEGDDVEGLGIVFLEAASYGIPVIAGRGGGVGEAVIDGETGYLIDPKSSTDLESAIRQLLHDPMLRNRFRTAGRTRIEREFLCSRREPVIQKIYD